MTGALQRWHALLVLRGFTRHVMMPPAFHALYLLYLKMRPFIQKARFVLPRRLYVPFSGRRVPRCSKTRILACCSIANWTMRALDLGARSVHRRGGSYAINRHCPVRFPQ